MRKLLFLVVAPVLVLIPPSAFAQISDITAALVRIYSKRPPQQTLFLGAGVLINQRGTVLTAYHVIQGAQALTVRGANGIFRRVSIVAFDSRQDIAMLRVADPETANPIMYLPVGQLPLHIGGLQAFAWGYPDGKPAFEIRIDLPYEGLLTTKQYRFEHGARMFAVDNVHVLPFDGTIDPGMSGGPVILDGKVIAVISGTQAPRNRALGWAIPATAIQEPQGETNISLDSLPPVQLVNSDYTSLLLKSAIDERRYDAQIAFLLEVQKQQQTLETLALQVDPIIKGLTAVLDDNSAPTIDGVEHLRNEFAKNIPYASRLMVARTRFLSDLWTPLVKESGERELEYGRLYDAITDETMRRIKDLDRFLSKPGLSPQDLDEMDKARKASAAKKQRVDIATEQVNKARSAEKVLTAALKGHEPNIAPDAELVEGAAHYFTTADSRERLNREVAEKGLPYTVAAEREILTGIRNAIEREITSWRNEMKVVDAARQAGEAFLRLYSSPEVVDLGFQ
jgi:hypothetical protein